MKTTRDFCINSRTAACLLGAAVLLLAASCETTGGAGGASAKPRKPVDRKGGRYQGLTFSIDLPSEVLTNKKQTREEIVHYFFTEEMEKRGVGMGIYEGVGAKSMTRLRNDLVIREEAGVTIDWFVGSVTAGRTKKGKVWREFFLFPKSGDYALQIWYFDVEPDDDLYFMQMVRSLKTLHKKE